MGGTLLRVLHDTLILYSYKTIPNSYFKWVETEAYKNSVIYRAWSQS